MHKGRFGGNKPVDTSQYNKENLPATPTLKKLSSKTHQLVTRTTSSPLVQHYQRQNVASTPVTVKKDQILALSTMSTSPEMQEPLQFSNIKQSFVHLDGTLGYFIKQRTSDAQQKLIKSYEHLSQTVDVGRLSSPSFLHTEIAQIEKQLEKEPENTLLKSHLAHLKKYVHLLETLFFSKLLEKQVAKLRFEMFSNSTKITDLATELKNEKEEILPLLDNLKKNDLEKVIKEIDSLMQSTTLSERAKNIIKKMHQLIPSALEELKAHPSMSVSIKKITDFADELKNEKEEILLDSLLYNLKKNDIAKAINDIDLLMQSKTLPERVKNVLEKMHQLIHTGPVDLAAHSPQLLGLTTLPPSLTQFKDVHLKPFGEPPSFAANFIELPTELDNAVNEIASSLNQKVNVNIKHLAPIKEMQPWQAVDYLLDNFKPQLTQEQTQRLQGLQDRLQATLAEMHVRSLLHEGKVQEAIDLLKQENFSIKHFQDHLGPLFAVTEFLCKDIKDPLEKKNLQVDMCRVFLGHVAIKKQNQAIKLFKQWHADLSKQQFHRVFKQANGLAMQLTKEIVTFAIPYLPGFENLKIAAAKYAKQLDIDTHLTDMQITENIQKHWLQGILGFINIWRQQTDDIEKLLSRSVTAEELDFTFHFDLVRSFIATNSQFQQALVLLPMTLKRKQQLIELQINEVKKMQELIGKNREKLKEPNFDYSYFLKELEEPFNKSLMSELAFQTKDLENKEKLLNKKRETLEIHEKKEIPKDPLELEKHNDNLKEARQNFARAQMEQETSKHKLNTLTTAEGLDAWFLKFAAQQKNALLELEAEAKELNHRLKTHQSDLKRCQTLIAHLRTAIEKKQPIYIDRICTSKSQLENEWKKLAETKGNSPKVKKLQEKQRNVVFNSDNSVEEYIGAAVRDALILYLGDSLKNSNL